MEREKNPDRGFTFVEALVVVVVGAMLLGIMYQIFSRSTRETLKGQDDLDTIREGSQLLGELKKDLLACHDLQVQPTASFTLNPQDFQIPELPAGSDRILLFSPTATITYSLEGMAGGEHMVKRTEEVLTANGPITKSHTFGEKRVLDFRIGYVWKKQQIQPGHSVSHGQAVVKLELDSKDERFPSRKLSWSTFLITPRMSSTQWKSLE